MNDSEPGYGLTAAAEAEIQGFVREVEQDERFACFTAVYALIEISDDDITAPQQESKA